ncbi:MAG: hypothetical protein AAF959_26615 [Cyanobacteria bacterium P01_D01_bin.56]
MPKVLSLVLLCLTACTTVPPEVPTSNNASTPATETVPEALVEPVIVESATIPTNANGLPVADVVSVAVTGEAANYTFATTINSADTGCEQYADWWEVADPETGQLIYRRILAHSHTNEQPFTRSGGPVEIGPEQTVVIRGHMGGVRSNYGGQVLSGSVTAGFQPIEDPLPSLESVAPLPTGCAF